MKMIKQTSYISFCRAITSLVSSSRRTITTNYFTIRNRNSDVIYFPAFSGIRHYGSDKGGVFEGPGATAPQKPPELSDFVEPLQGEHVIIEACLGAFEGYCIALRRQMKEADPKDLATFVVFFREFVDQKHFKKEESILFPALSGRISAKGVQEVITEHKKIREMVMKLHQITTKWDSPAVVKVGLDFLKVIRIHMEKEDRGLFPVICNAVPNASIPAIAEKFRTEDAVWQKRTKELVDLAFALAKKYTQYVP